MTNPGDKTGNALDNTGDATKGAANEAGVQVSKAGNKVKKETDPTLAQKAHNAVDGAGKAVGDAFHHLTGHKK
jgi:hypothetical protein